MTPGTMYVKIWKEAGRVFSSILRICASEHLQAKAAKKPCYNHRNINI
jgi:hypothetical protein